MLILSERARKRLQKAKVTIVYVLDGEKYEYPARGKVLVAARVKYKLWDENGRYLEATAAGIQYIVIIDGDELDVFTARMQYYEFNRKFRVTARLRRRYIRWQAMRALNPK